ncbi:hypothetical protein [Tenacibaculum sp. 1_MG-2023]|uniref:hypothetical protein n=1 Tax=Tenacibaculum sp. 1_MG-2023 TaxID=3062653 RepID=UPI0026E48880|nr:hypothetical protein [Tenacibaculum sp. 1_MG-2023]MDO6599724.1 hypothetical protein [Tenacibaculum sp. 1_MG-2023]
MNKKKEKLLTLTELEKIEFFSEKNQQFKDPFLLNITQKYSDIMKISPINGLILIKGNEFTGFEHIRTRHEQWISSPNWAEYTDNLGEKKIRLQNQSLFRKDSTPFFDYCNIADSIYNKENLNLEQNKNKDKFDLYIGYHKHIESSNTKYKLVLYKDTKIIHTLYPQSDKNNPKKVKGFNLLRKGITGSWETKNCIIEIKIPYINKENKIIYLIVIRKSPYNNLEKAYIQINHKNEKPWKTVIIGERKIEMNNLEKFSIEMEVMRWYLADLRILEKRMLELEKERQK